MNNKIRLFIENREIELDKDVQFAITKQFKDLSDPNAIINDWSKTVNIPFTQHNNSIFGDLYREDRIIVERENIAFTAEHFSSDLASVAMDWKSTVCEYLFESFIDNLTVLLRTKDQDGNVVGNRIIATYSSTDIYENTFSIYRDTTRRYDLAFRINLHNGNKPTFAYELPKDSDVFSYKFNFARLLNLTDVDEYGDPLYFGSIRLERIHINRGNKIYTVDDDLFGIYFNPLRRLSFRLVNGENTILTGYAKTIGTTQTDGQGYYNITLNGEIGGVFKEMQKIIIKGTEREKDVENKYLLDSSKYIIFNINKDTVKSNWEFNDIELDDTLLLRQHPAYQLSNYIGFAPSNARDEGFDYKLFAKSPTPLYDDFASTLAARTLPDGSTFQSRNNMTAEQAIPNGLNPRDIGEFRSYLQQPYIFWNKLIQMYLQKVEEVTGYKTVLDPSWFNSNNPYWHNLVMMLNKINPNSYDTFINKFDVYFYPGNYTWSKWEDDYDPLWMPKWDTWMDLTSERKSNQATTTDMSPIFFIGGSIEDYPLDKGGFTGEDFFFYEFPEGENVKIVVNDPINVDYVMHYTDNRMSEWPNYPNAVEENAKKTSNSTYGTISGANMMDFDGHYLDFWEDVFQDKNIAKVQEYTEGVETTYEVEYPIELARAVNDNYPPRFNVQVLLYRWTRSGLSSRLEVVPNKSEQQYYYTKDSVTGAETVTGLIGNDASGYEIPSENCFVKITAKKWVPSGSHISYHSNSMDFIFKIPVQYRQSIKAEDLDSSNNLFAFGLIIKLENIHWCSQHYTVKGGGTIIPRNTAGYITILAKDKKGNTLVRYNFLNEDVRAQGPAKSNRYPLASESDYLRNNDKYFLSMTEENPSRLNMTVTTGNKRSNSIIYLSDMWDSDTKLFDLLLQYCKTYRIGIFLDDIKKTLSFMPFSTYFTDYNILDWTDKVDKSKEYKVEPVSFDSKYVLFDYKDSKTKLGKDYKERFGYNFGEELLNTNYEFDSSTKKLFGKAEPSISYTYKVLSWSTLYDGLQYKWTEVEDIIPYSLGDEDKHNNIFGQSFFYKGTRNFTNTGRQVQLSDDTDAQDVLNKYFYSQAGDSSKIVNVNSYPYLDIYFDTEANAAKNNYCLFNVPKEAYTVERQEDVHNKSGIYELLWDDWVNETYNKNGKKVTCYLKLSITDYSNFEFKNFIKIGNMLYMVNKIFDYNMISQTTKVELITISDIKSLIYNDFISKSYSVYFHSIDGDNETMVTDTIFSETYLITDQISNYPDGCMFLTDDQLKDNKTIKWEPQWEYTDEELGMRFRISEYGQLYGESYKTILKTGEDSFEKNIYVMNKTRSYGAVRIIKYRPSN